MKKNKLSKKKIIILAVAAAVVAGGLWYFLSPDEVSVAAEKVKRGEFSDSFKENGTYTTGKNADVISEAGGNIVAVSVKAGTQVKQGDVIAVLDGSDYENEKSSHENLARSYLAEADNADKTEKDTKQDNVNAFEIEMKTAKNTLDTAEKNYGDAKQSMTAASLPKAPLTTSEPNMRMRSWPGRRLRTITRPRRKDSAS